MRSWMYAAAALLVLAGCGQQGAGSSANGGAGASSSNGGGSVFPNMAGASYRVEGVMHRPNGGGDMNMVQIRSGKQTRTEFSDPASGSQMASVMNLDTKQGFTLTTMGGRQMAMRIDLNQVQAHAPQPGPDVDFDPSSVTRTGSCSAAGETGSDWARTVDGHTINVCMASDGVILKQGRDGVTYWEATSVQRGPQDPSLFTIPAGVQVMDMSQMAGAMAGRLQQLREKAGQ